MLSDDLSAPLGKNAAKKRRIKLPVTTAQLITGVLTLVVLTFAGWAIFADDPLGGEPMAVIAIAPPPKIEVATPAAIVTTPGPGPVVVTQQPATTQAPLPPGTQTITIIDGSTGKRLVVPIGSPQAKPAASPQDKTATSEQSLFEVTKHGAIPKIGPDGQRPADVFARAATIPPNAPRIAIVIGGLGVSAAATQDALKLPGPVTLAFLPYAPDVANTVTKARLDGHEVLLQAPMEPFDYPDNDSGPQTLMNSLNAEQNLDRLHWQMSRFQGYVGIANYMGARFTSFEPAFAPVVRDIGARGLIYFDDAASARSLAGQIAGANGVPFARADVTLDSVASPAHIDAALTRLEATARQRGVAIGVASALPATIARIAQWAKAVENRGFVLVPITAIAAKPKSS